MNTENEREPQSGTSTGVPSFEFSTIKTRGRKSKVTALLNDERAWLQFLSLIEKGSFDWVAAGSIGVVPSTFQRWIRKGQEDSEQGRKTQLCFFYEQVNTARCRARARFEIECGETSALQWLKCGPGKTTHTSAGWTEHAATIPNQENPEEFEFVGMTGFENPSQNDLAQTLQVLSQLGFFEDKQAKTILQSAPGGLLPSIPENDDEFDDDIDDTAPSKGYNPERGLDHKDVTRVGPNQVLPDDLPPNTYDDLPPLPPTAKDKTE